MRERWERWARTGIFTDKADMAADLGIIRDTFEALPSSEKIPIMTRDRNLPELLKLMISCGPDPEKVEDFLISARNDLKTSLLNLIEVTGMEGSRWPSGGKLGFYINLDERGEFYADIRDMDGVTVWEVRSDDDGSLWPVEYGYMRNKEDLEGLSEYLSSVGIIPEWAEILPADAFENLGLRDEEEMSL